MDQSVAIVTGAARGIGRSIAQALAQRGDRVVVADIDKAGGEAAADALDPDSSKPTCLNAKTVND